MALEDLVRAKSNIKLHMLTTKSQFRVKLLKFDHWVKHRSELIIELNSLSLVRRM